MSDVKVSKNELELLSAAINKIVSSEILENEIAATLPKIDDLTDSNKIYQGKVSVLFVDMRGSTKLLEQFNKEQLVKIYRSYIRTVVQAIRYSGGEVRDFMGDGVLAVFSDDEQGKSEDKSVYAARYIATVIDKVLNPVLDKEMKHRISCGIGIHTGDVSLSKVGMKGKEQDEESENEYGIAWIGNSTNMACKFSGAVERETIFICTYTFSNLSNLEEKKNWSKIEIEKGSNILNGYIAEKYYLDMDEDIQSCVATQLNPTIGIKDSLTQEYKKQLKDISEKAELLGKKEQELIEREKKLNIKSADLKLKEQDIYNSKETLKKEKYDFYVNVLGSGHCKKDYVKSMGLEFWERNLQYAIDAGVSIGFSEDEVKEDVSYAMVSIYKDLEIYNKAYDFLINQANGCSWLNIHVVQSIVEKIGYCERLNSAVSSRLVKGDLSPEKKVEFEKIKAWLILYSYKS